MHKRSIFYQDSGKRLIVCLSICLAFNSNLFAQSDSIISTIMSKVRKGKGYSNIDYQKFLQLDQYAALQQLDPYLLDPDKNVQNSAMSIIKSILYSNPKDQKVRRSSVNKLLILRTSKSEYIAQEANSVIISCKSSDFDEKSRKAVVEIYNNSAYKGFTAKLLGAAQITGEMNTLKKYLDTVGRKCPPQSPTVCPAWTTHLALARLGDKNSLEYCVNAIDNIEDIVYKFGSYMRDLGYMRQKLAIDALIRYLFSDESIGGGDDNDISFEFLANFALIELTQAIEDFPIAYNRSRIYTDNDLLKAREWIKAHPDYKIIR